MQMGAPSVHGSGLVGLDPGAHRPRISTSRPTPGMRCSNTGSEPAARHLHTWRTRRCREWAKATKPATPSRTPWSAMRERGDRRAIVLAVPQHALSDEQAARFAELPLVQRAELQVAVWRGRAADDPDDTGKPNVPGS